MNRIHSLAAPVAAIALILVFTAHGQGPLHHGEYMASLSQTMQACAPNSGEQHHRVDRLNLKAKRLLPDTVFAVFVTGLDDARHGAADYIGELETNEEGRGSLRVDAVIDARRNLNHAVLRLANPAADDACFTPASDPTSPLDAIGAADGSAGRTASLATIFISNSRSAGDNDSLFHTINWRFTKCDSTF